MTATAGVWAYNTTIGYSATSGGSYTTVATVKEIDEQKIKRKKIDLTNLTSPSNTEECQAGMVGEDAMKLGIIYAKAQHAALLAIAVSATPNYYWKITLSDGSTALFLGYISEFGQIPKAKVDDIYENDLHLQPVGPVTFTPAA